MKLNLYMNLIIALFSTLASANSSYTCIDINKESGNGPLVLNIVNSQTVVIFGKTARLDTKYKPEQNISYERFHFDSDQHGVYEDFLIQKNLLKGADTGFIKNEDKSEGFAVAKYSCRKNPSNSGLRN
jgi:hypothetical protein